MGAGAGGVQGRGIRTPLNAGPARSEVEPRRPSPADGQGRPRTYVWLFLAVAAGWLLLDQLSKTLGREPPRPR